MSDELEREESGLFDIDDSEFEDNDDADDVDVDVEDDQDESSDADTLRQLMDGIETEDEETDEDSADGEQSNAEADAAAAAAAEEEAKKVQTTEENARFADQRRQQQLEKAALERLQQSDEYQLAQILGSQSGKSAKEMIAYVKEQELAAQAQQRGIPVEYLREQEDLKRSLADMKKTQENYEFRMWESDIERQAMTIKSSLDMLDDNDILQAKLYMLEKAVNPNLPLEDVLYLLHNKKIVHAQVERAKQEKLAEMSGRQEKKIPLTPKGNKPSPDTMLTNDERIMARALGVSEKDYIKNRNA